MTGIVDSKAVDVKAVDSKAVDSKAVDLKAVDLKAVDLKAVDSKAVDSKSVIGEASDRMDFSPISEPDLRQRIALNIRNLRMARGISQEGLADLAKLHRTFVSQTERGLKNLSADSIRRLANALEVDPMELWRPIQESEAALAED